MRTSITAQQSAFFTQNGYIELEGLPFNSKELFSAAQSLAKLQPFGRDLWRKSEMLHRLLLRQLPPTLCHLMPKQLRLACDQWMALQLPEKPGSIKDLFCIQGLAICVLFISSEIPPPVRRAAALGIPPFANTPNTILFVKPHIVLDWPLLATSPANLYLAAYAFSTPAVYIHNPKDPAVHCLKELGYEFGDCLTDPHHPLIRSHS